MKELDDLIAISRKYGSDPDYVIAGGGNTSFKTADKLYVKASGKALATIDEDGFAVLDRAALAPMGSKEYSSDPVRREAEVKADLAAALLSEGLRPSVETSLHDCIEAPFVVHLHPALVNGLMCSVNAAERCAELFPDALYVEYTDPGYTLFKKVLDRIDSYKAARGKAPRVIFLQNHGIFVAGDDTAGIEAAYSEIMDVLSRQADGLPAGECAPAAVDAVRVVPAVRQILSRGGRGLKTVKVTDNALVRTFSESEEAFNEVSAPFSPDMVVYCKRNYIYVSAEGEEGIVSEAEEKIEAFTGEHGYTPKVIVVKGLGLLSVGSDAASAQIVADVFCDAMKIAFYARSFGGFHAMEPAWIDFIDSWEVENYRRKVATVNAGGRVQGKTIIVTGAAQGFGEGIAEQLVLQGANIVVADLNEQTGEKTAERFNTLCKGNKAVFVKTNVADMDSLNQLMDRTVREFGALDAFISNAGVVRAGSLEVMTPENFEFVTRINYQAYFYCAKVASAVMKLQTARDPEYFADIVQVNSKSGVRGSKANFAYAGSKFGGIGLTQSFALELAPFRIKVNSICPGNYYDGPLWSDPEKGLFIQYLEAGKVPGARTVADVKDYYLSQVPMRKGCNPVDVTKAILYAIDQTGETGQAIPVTGGQVMLA